MKLENKGEQKGRKEIISVVLIFLRPETCTVCFFFLFVYLFKETWDWHLPEVLILSNPYFLIPAGLACHSELAGVMLPGQSISMIFFSIFRVGSFSSVPSLWLIPDSTEQPFLLGEHPAIHQNPNTDRPGSAKKSSG